MARQYSVPAQSAGIHPCSKHKMTSFEENIMGSDLTHVNQISSSSKRRKVEAVELAPTDKEDDVVTAASNATAGTVDYRSPSAPRVSRKDNNSEEKRLRTFRKQAPQSYIARLYRARTQRMFLINRQRKPSDDRTYEEEVFDIAGTTGNIYQVTISKQPMCTCPDGRSGSQCKHIIYVLVNVLKAPENLACQLAFLSTELASIFLSAPTSLEASTNASATGLLSGIRKPIEGDCPVCVMEFVANTDKIVWCRAGCGNNIHTQCFEQWAASKPGQVKCVFCRTPWVGDEQSISRISQIGKRNAEGYVNVAGELGLSGQRDWTSYHQPWVSRRGYGEYGGYGRYG